MLTPFSPGTADGNYLEVVSGLSASDEIVVKGQVNLENGMNIRMVQELMGHANVETTEIYTHVMSKDLDDVKSPLDLL